RAQACLGSRKIGNTGRDSKGVVNVFSGLLKDARNGKSYVVDLRVEPARNGNPSTRHYVLRSAAKTDSAASFPWTVFEAAILSCLWEVKPSELITVNGARDEVLGLSGELKALEAEVEEVKAALKRKYSDALNEVLSYKVDRQKAVAALLAEASLRAADPLAES